MIDTFIPVPTLSLHPMKSLGLLVNGSVPFGSRSPRILQRKLQTRQQLRFTTMTPSYTPKAASVHSSTYATSLQDQPADPNEPSAKAIDVEENIERVIYGCRFMTFLGVAGSLLGSVLCFLKKSIAHIFRECRAVLAFWNNGAFPGALPLLPFYGASGRLDAIHSSRALLYHPHYRFKLTSGFCGLESSYAYYPFSPSRTLHVRWLAPHASCLKFNVDAGRLSMGAISLGGMLRDHSGSWVLGFMHQLPNMSILEGELTSIYTALTLLDPGHYYNVCIESDSQTAIDMLLRRKYGPHPLQDLVQACWTRASELSVVSFTYTPGEGNVAAHTLVQLAKTSVVVLHVLYQPPSVLCDILHSDAMYCHCIM